MILSNGDIDGEETTELDDRNPANDESKNKQNKPGEIESGPVREAELREGRTTREAGKNTDRNHQPKEWKSETILAFALGP